MDKLDQLFNFYHILYFEIIKIIKKVIKIYKYSSEISILIFSLYFSSYLQKKIMLLYSLHYSPFDN